MEKQQALTKHIQNSDIIIQFLKVLTQVFDEWDDAMESFLAKNKKFSNQLKAFESLNFTAPELITDLPKMFSPEQISILLNILLQLSQYGGKFTTLEKQRIQEFEELRKLIKDIRTNLHKLLSDKI